MKNKNIIKLCFSFLLVLTIFNMNVFVRAEEVSEEEISLTSEETSQEEVSNENSESMFDTDFSSTAYKFSEGKDSYLPFVKYAADRILIDKKLSTSGLAFSGQSIEVNEDVQGVDILFANDSIRVNGKMEYAVLFGGSNVTISSEIEKSLIIFGGEKVTIADTANVKGDIICYTPDLQIDGKVQGSVIGYATNVAVNGTVEKDLRIQTINLTLNDESIHGNLYVQTYNNDLKLSDKYSNATLKLLETKAVKKFEISILYSALISAAVFTLVYYIINSKTKEKFFDTGLEKVKKSPSTAILCGALLLLGAPVVFMMLTIISAIGLYMIGIPVIIVFAAYLLVFGLLSTFIVGAFITQYISKTKYLKNIGSDLKTKYIFAFAVFFILYILARLPYIGGYLKIILVMLSIGLVSCMLIVNLNNQNANEGNVNKNNENLNNTLGK